MRQRPTKPVRRSSTRGLVGAAVLLSLLGSLPPLTAVAAIPASAATAAPAAAAAASALTISRLRAAYLDNPLGIDDPTPNLGWQLDAGPAHGQQQTAYQVLVASSPGLLTAGQADLWDSGKITSNNSTTVAYAGKALTARQRVYWTVRVWDGSDQVSGWATPAHWEMGLLAPTDWTARWIANPDWLNTPHPLVINIPAQHARYVRINVTRLGKPLKEGWPDPVSRLQFAEVEVYGSGTLRSRGVPATASEVYEAPGQWGLAAIDDGQLTSNSAPHGYTGLEHHGQDVSAAPAWVQLDLGQDVDLDQVRLYPRTDTLTADGRTANFPEDFSIQARPSAASTPTTVFSVTGQAAPPPLTVPTALPIFSTSFSLTKAVASARLYATGLGVYEARLNGKKVGDAVLEPANTDYRQRVQYTTYDVTDQIRSQTNTLGFLLGNGIYNVPATSGRYQKFSGTMGAPKLIAQLEVTFTDGTSTTVASDRKWRTIAGPITFSGWFGGEDFDAGREPAAWDSRNADTTGWDQAVVTDPPTPTTVLSAQEAPPVKAMQTLTAVSVQQVAPGTFVYDLGRNIAGWPQVTFRGAQGTPVKLTPAELLYSNGTPNQSQSGGPSFFTYTPATNSAVTWHPRFSYYGFRWVQITGLATAPALADVQGVVLRAANDKVGSFTSSDTMLNSINDLVVRATESNMYSVLTDCPHREKLGWLEETHLLFDTVAFNFDTSAYYRQVARNLPEAQLSNGQMPEIAPEYTVFGAPFRDDPNWGGALIMVPWKSYQTYGDLSGLKQRYPAMQHYLQYLGTKASGNILNYGLGDWAAFDGSTPVAIAATTAYYRFATVMAAAATAVGDPGSTPGYTKLAADIATSFNAKYLNPTTNSYGSGSQASNALPLAAGMVPVAARDAVQAHVLSDVASRGGHLSTGEIGLRALLDSLGDAGKVDDVLALAENPTTPSYAAMVLNGATTLTEYWNGPAGNSSQNHFMLGAINDWAYRYLGGITPNAPGYQQFTVRPLIPTSMTRAHASIESAYGEIVSEWRRTGSKIRMDVTVPVNSTATVSVPLLGTLAAKLSTSPGAQFVRADGDRVIYQVGSGDWRFETRP